MRFILYTLFLILLTCTSEILLGGSEDLILSEVQSSPPVSIIDNGSSVTLSNGLVTGVIVKDTARMIELYKGQSQNLLGNGWYWDCDGNEGLYESVNNATYTLINNTDEQVEISCKSHGLLGGVLDYDVHYVLRRSESGFYAFVIFSTSDRPSWNFGQGRCVVRNHPDIFYHMAVDEVRQIIAPTPQELSAAIAAGGTLSPSEATIMPDGTVHDKYLYSNFVSEHYVHGWGGHGYGMWMITASPEFYNGGPTNQELTVHQTTTTPVILNMFQGGHYGSGEVLFETGETWQKLCGPVFLYVNDLSTVSQQWIDAKEKAQAERLQWPYSWMSHADYPLERGTVSGTLNIKNKSSEHAWVILAEPETPPSIPNWQTQCKRYQFYVRAEANGYFEIKNVRPGNYSLYAFVKGIPEEYRQDGIQVFGNQVTALGTIDWKPRKLGFKVWQIGEFDRSAGEYKYGDLFHDGYSWGMWYNYPIDFPNDVQFIVGQSNERNHWNYTQISYQKIDGTYHTPIWKVYFGLNSPVFGQAKLTVGIAAQRTGALEIQVNGTQIAYYTSLTAGDACVRNSNQSSAYELKEIYFNGALLRLGSNQITLKQFRGRQFANIMYDAICLEIPQVVDLNNDGYADILDLIFFSDYWLTYTSINDFNYDGFIDLRDFSYLSKNWNK